MVRPVLVAGRPIGPAGPCFIIAEAGVNHDGSLDVARALVDAAADAGADAVKFQTFDPDLLASPSAPKAEYQREATGTGGSQLEMLRQLALGRSDHEALAAHCRDRGILFLSTPFDGASAQLLETMGMPAFKVSSGDLTNDVLLAQLAAFRKPLLISTGMATEAEVAHAVDVIRTHGCEDLALLHCVSNYPADPRVVNLRAMDTMAQRFQVPIGYSDHTLGTEVAMAAVARGASILEKHLTLDCRRAGPDHRSSLEPDVFTAMVRAIRVIESALGHGRKEPAPSEQDVARVARKSVATARTIASGAVISERDLTVLRPGTGLPPSSLPSVVGRTARRDLPAGVLIAEEDLQ